MRSPPPADSCRVDGIEQSGAMDDGRLMLMALPFPRGDGRGASIEHVFSSSDDTHGLATDAPLERSADSSRLCAHRGQVSTLRSGVLAVVMGKAPFPQWALQPIGGRTPTRPAEAKAAVVPAAWSKKAPGGRLRAMMCQVRSRSAQPRPRGAGGVFRAERTRASSLRPELLRTTSTGRVSGPIVRRHGLCEVSFTGSSPLKNHDLERPGRPSRSNRAVSNHPRLARCPASPRRPTEHDRRSCAPSTGVHRTEYRRRGTPVLARDLLIRDCSALAGDV